MLGRFINALIREYDERSINRADKSDGTAVRYRVIDHNSLFGKSKTVADVIVPLSGKYQQEIIHLRRVNGN